MMFLPGELRDELAQRGITAPEDGTAELDRWVGSLRAESPEVYRLVLAHASASAPQLDSEQFQARRQRAGAPARTVRRLFSRRTSGGERVANRKLALTSVLGVVAVVLLVGMAVSGLRQMGRRPAAEAPPLPAAEAPAPSPSPPAASASSPAGEPSSPAAQAAPEQTGQVPQVNLPSQPPTVALPPLPGNTGNVPSVAVPPVGGTGPVVYERPRQALGNVVVAYERANGGEEGLLPASQALVVFEAAKPASQSAPSGAQIITPGSGASATAGTQPLSPAKPVPASVALQPGQRIEATLQTGIVVAEGAAPTPVVVASKEGTWLGAAQLGPGGRVQVALQQLISENAVATVQALVLDKETQAPGLAGKARTVNPQTAQTMLAGVAQGVAEFMKATANASQVTTTNGFLTITSGAAGPWWSYILGGVATQVPQLSPAAGRPVTVVEIGKDKPVTILVLSAPGATP